MAGKARLYAGRKESGVRETPWNCRRLTLETLAGKPQPRGDTQINRNGLN